MAVGRLDGWTPCFENYISKFLPLCFVFLLIQGVRGICGDTVRIDSTISRKMSIL